MCRGDPPPGGSPCGANGLAPIDQSNWPTETVEDDAGGNDTVYFVFSTEGGMCYDPATGSWKYRIDRLFWEGKINVTLKGSFEPDPRDGGNITRENYCEALEVLRGYLGRGRETGENGWHTRACSLAHEEYHRDVDWPNIVRPLWRAAEAALEAECVACGVSAAEARVRLSRKRDETLAKLEANFK